MPSACATSRAVLRIRVCLLSVIALLHRFICSPADQG